jgi:hypothetical protein
MEKVFKYKLDFYYIQTVIYLLTLIVYASIRGSFIEDKFTLVFRDPIVYLILLFSAIAVVTLVLNLIRNRRLIIYSDKIIFQHRFQRRVIPVEKMEWISIGRESFVQTSGRFQIIVIKMKTGPRLYRIRLGRYEKARELVAEIENITKDVPRRKLRRFSLPKRITNNEF